jgi:hypothetical protein
VLGRVRLGARERLRQRRHLLDLDVRVTGDEHPHLGGDAAVEAEQERPAVVPVLGLREEVGGALARVGRRVGDHDDLAGAGGEIDGDARRDEHLRGGDPGVAGADDLVDRSDRRRPVGERRHRLRAADGVDLLHPELACRRERRLCGARRDDDDALDPREARRHGGHHERRRIRRAATGDVDADGRQRQPAPLRRDPRQGLDEDVGRALRPAELGDGPSELADRGEHVVGQPRGLQPLAVDPELGPFAVEALRPVEESVVAAVADVAEDLEHPREHCLEAVPHGTSRSTGRTRIEEAPAALSGASRSHSSSTSTAAWTAICPSSASPITDGGPMLGSSSRIAGSTLAGAFIIR